jgi:hypothetical protein
MLNNFAEETVRFKIDERLEKLADFFVTCEYMKLTEMV